MKKTIILLLAAVLCVAGISAGGAIGYVPVAVDAPFAMKPVRELVFPQRDFVITDFGAVPDSTGANTCALAAAIDSCNKAGGGRVIVPRGRWHTGPVHLKSYVDLHLDEGAELVFSDDPSLYLPAVMTSWEGMECYNYSPLVYAIDCEDVAITGKGTLAPDMGLWREWFKRPPQHMKALKKLYTMASTDVPVAERQMAEGENNMRPHLIHFNRCRNVMLDGFAIRQSPFWTIHMYMCDGGLVRGLDVKATGHNNDGIDLEMSRNFLVENCTFEQGDDAVVIKSGRNRDAWRLSTPSENIVIRNCTIRKGHVLLGIGSEISGGVRNVYIHNCTMPGKVMRLFYVKTNHRRGAFVENIYMDSIEAGDVDRIMEIDPEVLYQWKDLVPTYVEKLTKIKGLHMKNVHARSTKAIYDLKGDARLHPCDVTIENVHVDSVAKFMGRIENVDSVRIINVTATKKP